VVFRRGHHPGVDAAGGLQARAELLESPETPARKEGSQLVYKL